MKIQWNEVDPRWAWEPYRPTAEAPWDTRRAAHLLRRAGFGAHWEEVQEAVRLGPEQTLASLFEQEETEAEQRDADDLARAVLAGNDPRQLTAWWLRRIRYTSAPLRERMTLFWHGHFCTSAAKVPHSQLMLTQYELFRENALGSFPKMVQQIARDPAMLLYLDSATNRKQHPNENFARELLELFTLGIGNYTEADIQELACCFTGWEVHRGRFVFDRYQHDTAPRTLFGKSGTYSGEEAISCVLAQPAVGEFLTRKLVRFFITEQHPLTAELLAPLAEQLRQDELQIEPTVRRLLASNLFHSSWSLEGRIRAPVELALVLLRETGATTNFHALAGRLETLGQSLFFPPNVKGWAGGTTWINTASLLARQRLTVDLLGEAGNLPQLALDDLLAWQLPVAPPAEVVEQLAAAEPSDLRTLWRLLTRLPEYQLY